MKITLENILKKEVQTLKRNNGNKLIKFIKTEEFAIISKSGVLFLGKIHSKAMERWYSLCNLL